jgi:hypothetical protein
LQTVRGTGYRFDPDQKRQSRRSSARAIPCGE